MLDFGVAKVKDAAKVTMQKTGVGTLIGTPHYMSPEQVKGIGGDRLPRGPLGPRHHRLPVRDRRAARSTARASAICSSRSPSATLPCRPTCTPARAANFDAWFAKACARDPAKRFQSAREMAVALAGVVGVVDGRGAPFADDAASRGVAAGAGWRSASPEAAAGRDRAARDRRLGGRSTRSTRRKTSAPTPRERSRRGPAAAPVAARAARPRGSPSTPGNEACSSGRNIRARPRVSHLPRPAGAAPRRERPAPSPPRPASPIDEVPRAPPAQRRRPPRPPVGKS